MATVYEQHRKAFERVSAYVITHGADRVATIAIKFPADGAGRLWVYVHWIGVEMVRAYAGGYGYDKRSAALESAARKMPVDLRPEWGTERDENEANLYRAFRSALIRGGDANTWDRELRDARFQVWGAVSWHASQNPLSRSLTPRAVSNTRRSVSPIGPMSRVTVFPRLDCGE